PAGKVGPHGDVVGDAGGQVQSQILSGIRGGESHRRVRDGSQRLRANLVRPRSRGEKHPPNQGNNHRQELLSHGTDPLKEENERGCNRLLTCRWRRRANAGPSASRTRLPGWRAASSAGPTRLPALANTATGRATRRGRP